jgi:transposase
MGCEAFMTAPSLVPVRTGDRVKNDRRDSVKLAELLRAGLLKPVSELSEQSLSGP